MRINLRRSWFAPDGNLYEPSGNPHTFPDDWEEKLPSTAKEAEDEYVPPKPKPEAKIKL